MKKKHEKNIRGFYHLSKAWYGKVNLEYTNIKDIVTFGHYCSGGGTSGEMSMKWYKLAGDFVPRLEVFNDAWHILSIFTDLIQALGKVDDQNIDPSEFCEILLSLGFKDLTPNKSPFKH